MGIVNEMLALFLGAGFSKWAADLPVASQLFDFEIELYGTREAGKLEIVKSLKQKWDETHPDGFAEQFIAEALNGRAKRGKGEEVYPGLELWNDRGEFSEEV